MPEAAVRALAGHLASATCFLEFGCGDSTVLAKQLGCPLIVSVDTSKEFLDKVVKEVPGYAGQHVPLHVDLGRLGDGGVPATMDHVVKWGDYCRLPLKVLNDMGRFPDVVLINGRFRVASFLSTLMTTKPGARILFDDYLTRPQYHCIERVVIISGRHDRMIEVVVPKVLNLAPCIELLLGFTHDRA